MWNSKNNTFGAVMHLSFTYTEFLTDVPNMVGGAPQNLMGEVFEKNRKMGVYPPPPCPPWISKYHKKYT